MLRSFPFRAALGLICLVVVPASYPALAQPAHTLTIQGTRFFLDGEPFEFAGVSFFNAIYNPAFNESWERRLAWMDTFGRYGINVLRVWGQWDNARGFVDACATCTLYRQDGSLRQEHVDQLKAIVEDADRRAMVIHLALFARESWNEGIRLDSAAARRAVEGLTRALRPYRNVTFQVWNEHSERVLEHMATIKALDPERLVTNSPGYGGDLGDDEQNEALDFLTPHTSRPGRHWEIAPREVALLLEQFGKPVVDDEGARTGTRKFGGPSGESHPADFILHMYNVRQAGGYPVYHHDMFQTGYGSEAVPPSGIPEPEYSAFHRPVFEFLARRDRYAPVASQPGR